MPGKYIQSGNMVPVFMGQEYPAEVLRFQATILQSLDDPPARNPCIDQDRRLAGPDQGGIPLASAGQYIHFKISHRHGNTVLYKNVGAPFSYPAIILTIIAKTLKEM